MIGIIGGTTESKNIIKKLNKFTNDIFISVATEQGKTLYSDLKYSKINSQPLDANGFKNIIKKNNIKLFIDASHPYAINVTSNIKRTCTEFNIAYFRLSRKPVLMEYSNNKEIGFLNNYYEIDDYITDDGNILNTTGSNNISEIMKTGLKNRIIHRILPVTDSLEKCYQYGVKTEDIIAVKGPFTIEFNKNIMKNYNIRYLIMKDSGNTGGTMEKFNAAQDLKVKIMVLKNKEYYNLNKVFYDCDELSEIIKKRL